MERSLHSRGFRTPCTFRHRCRQSPQRSIRFPSRSMWMIMYLSVSSTLVTVCAFNLSCFLRNVSMSTSILFLSVAVHHCPQKIRCIGDSDQPLHRQPAASKTLRLQLHFRDRNRFVSSANYNSRGVPKRDRPQKAMVCPTFPRERMVSRTVGQDFLSFWQTVGHLSPLFGEMARHSVRIHAQMAVVPAGGRRASCGHHQGFRGGEPDREGAGAHPGLYHTAARQRRSHGDGTHQYRSEERRVGKEC